MTWALRAIRLVAAFFLGVTMEVGALIFVSYPASLDGQSGCVVLLRGDLPAVAIVSVLTLGLLALVLWGESVPAIPVAAFLVGCGLVFVYVSAVIVDSFRDPGTHGSALKFAAVSVARGIVLPLIAVALLWYKRRRRGLLAPEPVGSIPAA